MVPRDMKLKDSDVSLDAPVASAWETYKGAGAATTLSFMTAALFVLRSKEPSSVCNEIVLWWSEVVKLVVAFGIIVSRGEAKKMCYKVYLAGFPTISYMCISLLTYWALKHMDASAAAFISQVKLPATAFFSWILLGRTLSLHKFQALFAICLASLGIAVWTDMQKEKENAENGGDSEAADKLYTLALLAVLTESSLSAFTGVYTQWLFEGSFATLWIRNVQLGFLSTIMYAIKASREESCLAEGSAWMPDFALDTRGVVIAVMQAVMGLAVALTLLWLGAIEKTLASISSIVLTSVWEHIGYLHVWPPLMEVLLDMMVILHIFMYAYFP